MYTVMIVEDEMLVRSGLKASINWDKFDMKVISEAANGLIAWEEYQRCRPDIILTDIRMPVMNGIELIENIRRHHAPDPVDSTKIVILTCVDDFQLAKTAIHLGVSGYILKLTMTTEEMEDVLAHLKAQLDTRIKPAATRENAAVSLPLLEEGLLRYLLYQTGSIRHADALLDYYHLKNQTRWIQIILLRIDQYENLQDLYQDQQGRLIHFSMMNIFQELLHKHRLGFALGESQGHYLFFLASPCSTNAEHEHKTQLLLKETAHILKDYFNVTATISASSVNHNTDDLHRQYQECCRRLHTSQTADQSHYSREVAAAVGHIQEHYPEAITLPELADLAGLSASYFSSLFKKEMGMSLFSYLNSYRIRQAIRLLQTTNLKNYEIAYAVGFQDESYFSKMFKKITGKRPNDYKKHCPLPDPH